MNVFKNVFTNAFTRAFDRGRPRWSSRALRRRRRLGLVAATAASMAASGLGAPALAEDAVLHSPNGQAVHALIIGIDAYQRVRPLKGAAADARDIESVLRKMGVTDVIALIDEQAERTNVVKAIDELTGRINPGDLVVLSIAGHGAQEPEKIKGSQPDGMDDVFLLAGFENSAAGSQQRIVGREFNTFIKQFEARGANVVFVADTCHGGGMAREVDPRANEMSFRQVTPYVLTEDTLKPVGAPADAYLTELDFEHTAFLAAVDRKTKAPEVRIPGVEGLRGALSYAVARAFEGSADSNHDNRVTLGELFTQVRDVVYQLSNQRQTPVTLASPNRSIDADVAYVLGAGAQVERPVPARPQVAAVETPRVPVSVVRVAVLNGGQDGQAALAGLEQRETPFELSSSTQNADLVWDAKSHDVLSQGDVVAYRMDKTDLPSVIDRSAAVLGIKRLAARSPQAMTVGPDDKIHHDNRKVVVDIGGVAGRALVLFNIAGDGTVQMLYPVRSDAPIVADATYRLPVVVRSPYGADQVVAVTSEQRMLALEQALQQLNQRRSAMQVMRVVERYAPSDARIGTVGIFTAP